MVASAPSTDLTQIAPTALDRYLISELGNQIPLIVLPRLYSRPQDSSLTDKLSAFRPPTTVALRSGLFNSPETLSLLRSEATDRYFKWREVQRTVSHIHTRRHRTSRYALSQATHSKWDKAKWESDYLASLSHDVARARNATITRRQTANLTLTKSSDLDDNSLLPPRGSCGAPLDPLHLPSLFLFSISLLNPLRARLRKSISEFFESLGSEKNVRIALLGGFCIGLGIGVIART